MHAPLQSTEHEATSFTPVAPHSGVECAWSHSYTPPTHPPVFVPPPPLTHTLLQVTEVINELYNMRVVGWYHSHPSFPALPSVIDIANQLQVRMVDTALCSVVVFSASCTSDVSWAGWFLRSSNA
jgi:hypothetical protein